jgi:hypothetical protein
LVIVSWRDDFDPAAILAGDGLSFCLGGDKAAGKKVSRAREGLAPMLLVRLVLAGSDPLGTAGRFALGPAA